MEQIKEKRHSCLRINVRDAGYWLLLVLLTLPHMKPAYITQIPVADMIFDILRGGSFLLIVFWYVVKRKPISIVIVLTAVWGVLLAYSTLIHRGEVYNSILTTFSMLSVMLLYDTAYNSDKSIFLSAQLFCFELMIYINLFTVLAFPRGLYRDSITHRWNMWFLGYYNTHTQYFVPAIMFAWLYRDRSGKRIRALALQLAIYITAFTVWSGGEIVLLLSMGIVYTFFKNKTTIFNYATYWLLHIYFFVFIILLKFQNLFEWLIDDFLGKWNSLITRMDLWERHIQHFLRSPIIGYGIQNGYAVRVPENGGMLYAVHAHNLLLELLYQSGIIGIVCFAAIVILSGRNVMRHKESQESKLIATAFLGWCVATLVEPYMTPFLMGMFVIAHRSNRSERMTGAGERLPEVNAV